MCVSCRFDELLLYEKSILRGNTVREGTLCAVLMVCHPILIYVEMHDVGSRFPGRFVVSFPFDQILSSPCFSTLSISLDSFYPVLVLMNDRRIVRINNDRFIEAYVTFDCNSLADRVP